MNKLFYKLALGFSLVVFSQLALAEPVAVLPEDKAMTVGSSISIDGSSSFDEGGANLIYRWSIDIAPKGFNSQIDDPKNSSISFMLDTAGFYLIRLIVNNGDENSEPAYMVIRVSMSN